MKCPKCHSTNVETTTLGEVEQAGAYAVAALGIAAAKIGVSLLGGRSMTPSWDSVKKELTNLVFQDNLNVGVVGTFFTDVIISISEGPAKIEI